MCSRRTTEQCLLRGFPVPNWMQKCRAVMATSCLVVPAQSETQNTFLTLIQGPAISFILVAATPVSSVRLVDYLIYIRLLSFIHTSTLGYIQKMQFHQVHPFSCSLQWKDPLWLPMLQENPGQVNLASTWLHRRFLAMSIDFIPWSGVACK